MRAVCYARVSSKVQKDRQTVENQLRALPDFVARQGWKLVRPATTYVDDGRTAKAGHLDKRDALTRLLKDAAAGLFDVVAVVDLDRLTRSEDIAERGQVIGAFQRAGVKLALASSGQVLDLASSMGDLFSGLQAFFAAEENRKRRERTVAGKLRAIAEGKKPAGPTPFGYAYDRDAGWSVDQDQAQVVVEIFERVARGESCEVVARELDRRGLARPRGGEWIRERVWQIAVSRTYLGQWTADKTRGLSMPVPPIVPEELWTATQRAFTKNRKRGLVRTKHVYLLEQIATCDLCDARIGISTGSGKLGKVYRRSYYTCCHRRRPLRCGPRCTLPYREVHETDERLWAAVTATLTDRRIIERGLAARAARRTHGRTTWREDLERAEVGLARLARAESAILARFRSGRVSESGLDAELAGQEAERAELERLRDAAQAAGAETPGKGDLRSINETLEGLRRVVRSATPERRRRLLLALAGEEGVTMGADWMTTTLRVRAGQIDTAGSKPSHGTSRGMVLELRVVA